MRHGAARRADGARTGGLLRSGTMTDAAVGTDPTRSSELPPGRTASLDPGEAERLFREGIALFNAARYWHAHESWETLWRAAPDAERDFYQGLIQVAAGLLHLKRRKLRGARNKLAEGLARLERYQPVHQGVLVNELLGKGGRVLDDLNAGVLPYLIPPVIRFVASEEPDFSR
jgi:tetratricopeptide (TPR) repeat protein